LGPAIADLAPARREDPGQLGHQRIAADAGVAHPHLRVRRLYNDACDAIATDLFS
jgi:hypothetical protein